MRVNYITPARKRHNVRIRRPRIAPTAQAPSPSLLPGFIPRTPRPFNAQRAEASEPGEPLPTPRSPAASSPDAKRRRGDGEDGEETRTGRNGMREPRFLPVHQGVQLGKAASPPRAMSPVKRPPVMRKNARPRFSFAQPHRKRDGGGDRGGQRGTYLHRLRAAPPPPRRGEDDAETADTPAPRVSTWAGMPVLHAGSRNSDTSVEQLLRMDLTGVRSARKRRNVTEP